MNREIVIHDEALFDVIDHAYFLAEDSMVFLPLGGSRLQLTARVQAPGHPISHRSARAS